MIQWDKRGWEGKQRWRNFYLVVGYDALINLFKSNLTTHHNLRELEEEIKINQIHMNKIFASFILFNFFLRPPWQRKRKKLNFSKFEYKQIDKILRWKNRCEYTRRKKKVAQKRRLISYIYYTQRKWPIWCSASA